ncbi:hypothetical protein D9758_011987 [Tetrapyrgos nigripes]|uniref:Uncharacterized protein n=1 Tax=Tetrapyrgos nigripes TaxID=182062 RepID=A0A8H5CRZ3_9AGAR|nr:hypothetical protein D9758_011987 [Tetrapyrgos nigripes]
MVSVRSAHSAVKGMASFASDIQVPVRMTVLELLTHIPPYAYIRHPQEVVLAKNERDFPSKPTEARVVERVNSVDAIWNARRRRRGLG